MLEAWPRCLPDKIWSELASHALLLIDFANPKQNAPLQRVCAETGMQREGAKPSAREAFNSGKQSPLLGVSRAHMIRNERLS